MANTDESTRQVLGAPDQLETRLGTLGFVDGVPNRETVETVYDHLDFVQALNVYLNAYAGATGSRRRRAGAGSRSFASTARSCRSSTSPGGRARSSARRRERLRSR